MARPLRVEFPDAIYHVTARGIEKKSIFERNKDKVVLLDRLDDARRRYGFVICSYCIMSNHYHLLVQTPRGNLSAGMRYLNSTFAQWYNRKYERCGPLFQGRYKSFLVEGGEYLLAAVRYILMNPVKAGIVRQVGAYPWSSFKALLGRENRSGQHEHPNLVDGSLIYSMFSQDLGMARRQVREFIGHDDGFANPFDDVKGNVLGSDAFIARVKDLAERGGKTGDKEISRKERFIDRTPLEQVFKEQADRCVKSRRNAMILSAFVDHGYTQKEIAAHLGIDHSTVSVIVRAQERAQLVISG